MSRPCRALLLIAVAAVACDRDSTPRADSARPAAPVAIPAVRSWQGVWATELGDILVVPSDSETALIVYPDDPTAEAVGSAPVTLLNSAGDTVTRMASLTLDDTLQCGDAAVVRVKSGSPTGWALGIRGASATPVPTDSIESLAARDSARTVAELARLASALTATNASRFTGLPFSVIGARRFVIGDNPVIAAHLVRRLPQEAAPLEEHTFVIAERRNAQSPYVAVFSQQSHGSEETARYYDAIAIVRTGDTILLILVGDATSGTEYQVLERSKAGVWRVRWTRPLAC